MRNSRIAVAIAAALALVYLDACASASARKTTYVTVGAARDAVDLAMRTWARYVANQGRCVTEVKPGCVPADQEDKVRQAYSDVRFAAQTAKVSLELGSQQLTPDGVRRALDTLMKVIERFTGKPVVPAITGGGQ